MRYEDARGRIKTGDMLLWRDHAGGSLRGIVERWIVRHATAERSEMLDTPLADGERYKG